MAKRGLCILLALAAVFSLSAPALAEEEVVTTEEPVVTEEPVEAAEVVETEEEPVEEPEEVEAQEAEPVTTAESGECGDGVTYTLTDNGTLTISGNGAIDSYAFNWRDDIKTVVIKNGVTTIWFGAFENCTSLTSVTIPASVTIIEADAFSGCSSLREYTVMAGNSSYSSAGGVLFNAAGTDIIRLPQAFSGVYNIPDGVTSIGGRAFYDCASLTGVTIPDGVTSIGMNAFSGCMSLTSVTIPDGVTSIGEYAFFNTSLSSVTIPASVTSIGALAFGATPWLAAQGDFVVVNGILLNYLGSAANVTIPNGVTSIGDMAFGWCTSLTSVTIPDGVTSIGYAAFRECYSLTSITIPSSVTSIGAAAFRECDGLTSVTLPAGVTSIGEYAFFWCPALTSVTLPDTLTSIADYAFNSCTALTSVTIPVSVTSIGTGAFVSCDGLTSVTVLNPSCTIVDQGGIGTSLGVPGQTVIHGYDGSTAQAYANQYGYKFESFGLVPVPDPTPEAPTVTISKAATTGIQVTWNAVPGSPRYMVYYRENGGAWQKIGTTTETTYIRVGTKLKSGATYQFTVRCCANDKKTLLSGYKASNSFTYNIVLPIPTVTISSVSAGIKVSWNAVAGSPRYMVYYRENNGAWHKIGSTTATTYTRKAANLKDGVTYQFTVRCCASDRKTTLSGYKASNSLRYTSQLAPPTVKIAKVSNGIKVTWNKVSGAPRYMVYYKEGNGGWVRIGTTTATTYTRKAANLKNGVTYQFTVRCCANDVKTMLSGYKASNSLKYTK